MKEDNAYNNSKLSSIKWIYWLTFFLKLVLPNNKLLASVKAFLVLLVWVFSKASKSSWFSWKNRWFCAHLFGFFKCFENRCYISEPASFDFIFILRLALMNRKNHLDNWWVLMQFLIPVQHWITPFNINLFYFLFFLQLSRIDMLILKNQYINYTEFLKYGGPPI
jgi:hypothetical protein